MRKSKRGKKKLWLEGKPSVRKNEEGPWSVERGWRQGSVSCAPSSPQQVGWKQKGDSMTTQRSFPSCDDYIAPEREREREREIVCPPNARHTVRLLSCWGSVVVLVCMFLCTDTRENWFPTCNVCLVLFSFSNFLVVATPYVSFESLTVAVSHGFSAPAFCVGRCSKSPHCPYLHDRSKRAICRPFLRGMCPFTASDCPLSHNLVCSFFFRGCVSCGGDVEAAN